MILKLTWCIQFLLAKHSSATLQTDLTEKSIVSLLQVLFEKNKRTEVLGHWAVLDRASISLYFSANLFDFLVLEVYSVLFELALT